MKRTLEEIANAEDSDDVDYDDKASRGPRRSRKKARLGKKVRRQRRYGHDSDISDDDDDIDEEDSFSEASHESEEVETNEKGRPVRRAVKAKPKYEEPDSDEDDFVGRTSASEVEEELEERQDRRKSQRAEKKTLLVKLKVPSPTKPTRNLRNRSGSYAGKDMGSPTEVHYRATRRSSRHLGDEEETLIALTDSGRHAQITRQGTRSPEGVPRRAMKGIKYPSKSTIEEESGTSQGLKNEDPDVDEPEIAASQDVGEVAEADEVLPRISSDIQDAAEEDADVDMEDGNIIAESMHEADGDAEDDEDDEDDVPITRKRKLRSSDAKPEIDEAQDEEEGPRAGRSLRRSARDKKPRVSRQRKGMEESSDFEPAPEDDGGESMSGSEASEEPRKQSRRRGDNDDSSNGTRPGRLLRKRSARQSEESGADEEAQLAEELAELKPDRRSRRKRDEEIAISYEPRRRGGKRPDYRLFRPENAVPIEDIEEDAAPTPTRRPRGAGATGGWQRSFLPTAGPFGGATGGPPVLGGPSGYGMTGGVDSDSSDDDIMQRPKVLGAPPGMTPMTASNPTFGLLPGAHGADGLQAPAGTPANLGKVKDRQALADADPLGVPQDVGFDNVGGLEGHIDQLKEMVALPLLYPEIFQRFHITPPRGVLFHGPPGTGKTLLARALANSVSSEGRKVTFYMRKGADALSKWVGEAERQLRLLFEEARKTQPSIIFFDEIDGLAPVRSSKQEQIHASIVSTLLALMDGMDGRGQVIVIGATNRPDSIDPALRRPGRFDREFYFPLPNTEARRAILDIHTKGWNPPLDPSIKDELAELTKGYGGADLRALCTEAALNAVQRRYPQIYRSNVKLLIDPAKIEVTPKDFMLSVKKMIPSSERSSSSGAAPLPASVEPLLRTSLKEIKDMVASILPQKKRLTALEEAQFEEPANDQGFRREKMQQNFETTRVFRPRLVVRGFPGMGQQYLASALLNHFEGLHVQSFDLPTLLSDSTRSQEAAVVQLFTEVKMHKPSVIYIPNALTWYATVGPAVINTFLGLLRSLKPTDPILVLGLVEAEDIELEEGDGLAMLRNLFGYSRKNQYVLQRPGKDERREFFSTIAEYIKTAPNDFPDPAQRKKRKPEILPPAPVPKALEPAPPSKEELKAQKLRDRHTLNMLKIQLQPIMDQIRTKYRQFRTGVIDENQIRYLYEESDPTVVTSDIPVERRLVATFRPYEKATDAQGEPVLREESTGRIFYNIDSVTIEKRLSNGYYKRPKDFVADIRRLAKDARAIGDPTRTLKANELLTNVEADVYMMETREATLCAECEAVYTREKQRERDAIEKARKAAEAEGRPMPAFPSRVANNGPEQLSENMSGAIQTGEMIPDGPIPVVAAPITPSRASNGGASGMTNGHVQLDMTTGGGSDLNNSSSHATTNGSKEEDVHMEGTDEQPNSNPAQRSSDQSSFGQSAQPRPPHSYTAPSQAMRDASGMSAPRSQVDVMTPLAPGSQPGEYTNEASTTQTTTDKRSSGPQNNTQGSGDSNKKAAQVEPDFGNTSERQDDLPPTQPTQPTNDPTQQSQLSKLASIPRSSQATDHADVVLQLQGSQSTGPSSGSQGPIYKKPAQHSPPPPVPPFDAQARPRAHSSNIASLLNDDAPVENKSLTNSEKNQLVINFTEVDYLLERLASTTSGCTVEQLEQINTALIDTIWGLRGEWDRNLVIDEVGQMFDEIMDDIKSAQGVAEGSWEA